jgi:hypothetical protein
MNQHEWVVGCQQYYLENDLTPGNPDDGVWHEAHYPVPRRLGGTKTILLLEEHHAVQGVLQSEEYLVSCVWGWEKKFLSGDLLELYDKWRSIQSRINANSKWRDKTEEEKKEWGRWIRSNKTAESHQQCSITRMRNGTHILFERGITHGRATTVTVYYPDGRVVEYKSLRVASKATGVPRGTIKSRLKWTLEEQRERLGTVSRT